MSKNYKMNFVVPTQKGIQQITFSPDKSYYIGDGGYCMFYNAIFIQTISNFIKLNKGLERTEFIKKFNNLYGRLTGNYKFKTEGGIPLYPVNVESGDNVDISKSLQRYILEIIIKFIPYYNHIIYNQVIDILKSNNKGMLKGDIKKNLLTMGHKDSSHLKILIKDAVKKGYEEGYIITERNILYNIRDEKGHAQRDAKGDAKSNYSFSIK